MGEVPLYAGWKAAWIERTAQFTGGGALFMDGTALFLLGGHDVFDWSCTHFPLFIPIY